MITVNFAKGELSFKYQIADLQRETISLAIFM